MNVRNRRYYILSEQRLACGFAGSFIYFFIIFLFFYFILFVRNVSETFEADPLL